MRAKNGRTETNHVPEIPSEDRVLLEGCVTSPAEGRFAFHCGAGRVELCRDLDVGGLTPSREDVLETLDGTAGPVFAMVRPADGSFRLSPGTISVMAGQVEEMVALGAAGVVLGVLDRRGKIDGPALADLVDAAGEIPVTFHRAFDELEDPLEGIDRLAEAGVRRVLTSGGRPTAWEGRVVLRALVQAAAGRITVMGGGRVRGDHVVRLVEETGLEEVHARCEAVPGVAEALRMSGRSSHRPYRRDPSPGWRPHRSEL